MHCGDKSSLLSIRASLRALECSISARGHGFNISSVCKPRSNVSFLNQLVGDVSEDSVRETRHYNKSRDGENLSCLFMQPSLTFTQVIALFRNADTLRHQRISWCLHKVTSFWAYRRQS